jgi:hydroxyacylglutathione hydrolase
VQIWQVPLWLAETNAYIVAPDGPGGECVLVDAPPDPHQLLHIIQENGLRLAALLMTHGHIDHVGGVTEVVKGSGEAPTGGPVPVHIHDHDKHMLLDPIGSSGTFGRYLEQSGLDVRPPELIVDCDDGTVISGAGLRFTTIHTPGHTRGSVCFRLDVDGEQPLLFSGDHLFAGSIGRTDLPGGSFPALMDSMREKIMPMSDDVAVLPGHGGATTIGHERRTNPFLLDLLDEGPSSGPG